MSYYSRRLFDKNSNEHNTCAGQGCSRRGTVLLKVRFLNKNGYFCEMCASDLLQLDIATAESGHKYKINNSVDSCGEAAIDGHGQDGQDGRVNLISECEPESDS